MITKKRADQVCSFLFTILLSKRWNIQQDETDDNEDTNDGPDALDSLLVLWI